MSAYDFETGIVTLETEVKYYHWGAEESTASTYKGVDIRGEVLILSRNIKISGEDVDSWGCQMVTSDTLEYDEATQDLI